MKKWLSTICNQWLKVTSFWLLLQCSMYDMECTFATISWRCHSFPTLSKINRVERCKYFVKQVSAPDLIRDMNPDHVFVYAIFVFTVSRRRWGARRDVAIARSSGSNASIRRHWSRTSASLGWQIRKTVRSYAIVGGLRLRALWALETMAERK